MTNFDGHYGIRSIRDLIDKLEYLGKSEIFLDNCHGIKDYENCIVICYREDYGTVSKIIDGKKVYRKIRCQIPEKFWIPELEKYRPQHDSYYSYYTETFFFVPERILYLVLAGHKIDWYYTIETPLYFKQCMQEELERMNRT